MAKLTLTDLSSLTNEASAISAINANYALIETALENTLSRDGTSPNSMSADFDLNGQDLLNGGTINCDSLTVDGSSISSSVTAAAASATAAASSATAAASSATSAASSASSASTAQTAAEAAQVLAEAASENAGLTYTYDKTATSGDGGSGYFRTDNNDLSSTTTIFINEEDVASVNHASVIASWDDVNNAVASTVLVLTEVATGNKTTFYVTYSGNTDNGDYHDVTVSYVDGATSFTDEAVINISWSQSGADGAGDVSASASITDNAIVRGDGGAKGVQSSGVTIDDSDNIAGATSITVGNTGLVVGSSTPFSDASGTLTLQNVDAIDATTESVIEAAIDTLANLTTIQGLTVTLADAGADAIFGWNDGDSAYKNLTADEAQTVLDGASDPYVQDSDAADSSAVNTGTSTSAFVTPDALAGSNYGTAVVPILVFGSTTTVTTGDGAGSVFYTVPSVLNGWDLVDVQASVFDLNSASAGATTIQVNNVTDTADMLSTGVTISYNEYFAADGSINTSTDDVATGDRLRIDVDSVPSDTSGNDPKGLLVNLHFRLP